MSKIKIYEAGEQLNRIADALEEVLRLVKEDQERSRKRYMEDRKAAMCCQADEDCPAEYRTKHFRSTMDAGSESVQILLHHWRWLMDQGQNELQATSLKLQAYQAASLTRQNYNVITSYKLKEKEL